MTRTSGAARLSSSCKLANSLPVSELGPSRATSCAKIGVCGTPKAPTNLAISELLQPCGARETRDHLYHDDAAVIVDGCSGHEGSAVGRHEEHDLCMLFRVGQAADRDHPGVVIEIVLRLSF